MEEQVKQAQQQQANAENELAKLKIEASERQKLEACFSSSVHDLAKIYAKRDELGLSKNSFHWIVCGESGAGKSYCINAIMGLAPGAPGAAPVGVTETTTVATRYTHPACDDLNVWDAPGCGTELFPFIHPSDPSQNYYHRFSIYAYDGVVICYEGRLREGSARLAKMCLNADQRVLIVRTKADQAITSLIDDCGMSESEAMAELHQCFEKELFQTLGEKTKVPHYLVSMRELRKDQARLDEYKFLDDVSHSAIFRRRSRSWAKYLVEQTLHRKT